MTFNMPKVELETYDDDPLKYHDTETRDGKVKLTRLLQYRWGKAKEAIHSCSLIGGEEGDGAQHFEQKIWK